jgi:hypothetical protein
VIRVRIPLDIHAVGCTGSGAFALATPLRVRDLISLAVREAIGARAPQDKCARMVGATLLGLANGRFFLDVDGRRYRDPNEVVVCRDVADVRFFLPARNLSLHH